MSVLEKISPAEAIALEKKYGAHNYHPLPVVLSRGEGVKVQMYNIGISDISFVF